MILHMLLSLKLEKKTRLTYKDKEIQVDRALQMYTTTT